ncbi:ATP synthase F0 subunit B [Patescibacteria group bacterium]|nr:MAG: ATP synthase F0 subunit B [Patescibacteria group bacterium]
MSTEIQQTAEVAQQVVEATEVSGGLGTLGINLKIFLAQLLNFAVVLFVLWKWAYKPIVKILEERQEKIERSVKHADDVEKRVCELETEQKKVIATAKSEAAKILDEARVVAEDRKKELLGKAKEEVKGVVAQGKGQLEAQKEQMIREAREEIAAIAVEAARKILTEGVDEKKATKLAEGVVDKMSTSYET